MSGFWSNVLAGTLGAVLSAAALAAVSQLQPFGLRLIIPEEAVIPMSGPCPAGWRQYDAGSGSYVISPSDKTARGHSHEPSAELITPFASAGARTPNHAERLVVPSQSAYMIFNLCQRR